LLGQVAEPEATRRGLRRTALIPAARIAQRERIELMPKMLKMISALPRDVYLFTHGGVFAGFSFPTRGKIGSATERHE